MTQLSIYNEHLSKNISLWVGNINKTDFKKEEISQQLLPKPKFNVLTTW